MLSRERKAIIGYICHCVNVLLQWTVCGRTGVHGVATSAVVMEPEHEGDHAPTLHPQMAVTIVKDHLKKRRSV